MFGIIDDNKKFIILDEERERLRITALGSMKKVEDGYVPMFTEDTVDEAIKEYEDEDIEVAYNGEKYLKGCVPLIDNEYQSKMREKAYILETDPIQTHIDRLKDKEQTPEIIAEIQQLRKERDEKIAAIKARYPYSTEE